MRRILLVPLLLLVAACQPPPADSAAEIAALRAELAALKQHPVTPATPPELGQQMLELQIRHARLWQAGAARNWLLTQFQLAELRESLGGVARLNGEHAAVQPQRLADLLPTMMDPPLRRMQAAVDAGDATAFDAAFDAVSAACSACHAATDHGFLVIQRPRTPVLDNLRASPMP